MNATIMASALLFECIDGKDDHFRMEISAGQKVLLGSHPNGNMTPIKELEHAGGCIILTNNNGLLQVDASDCAVPVKLNGSMISLGTLRSVDVLRIGNSIWKTFPVKEAAPGADLPGKSSLSKNIGNFIGLEGLNDFRLSNIFSGVFKKHTLEEMEEQLVTGTARHTPAITEIEVSWAKPWLFSRLIVLSVVLTLLLKLGFNVFENTKLIPGLIFIGTFVMPVATMIFFLEMNAPRNVSIFLVLMMLFIGGVASLLVTLMVSSWMGFVYSTFGTAAAALVEEPAKLLILVLVVGKYVRYKWVLNGLLLGAAVGAGFGAFESAGYAFDTLMATNSVDEGMESIRMRGLLAPFMHVVWTANAGAALWIVKGSRPFSWNMAGDPRFLRVFALSVATHFTWNASFGLLPIPIFVDLKFLLLGLLSWTVCFMLIQAGLRQLNEARHAELERMRAE